MMMANNRIARAMINTTGKKINRVIIRNEAKPITKAPTMSPGIKPITGGGTGGGGTGGIGGMKGPGGTGFKDLQQHPPKRSKSKAMGVPPFQE